MSGVIGTFAKDINDAAQVIIKIDTASIEGDFGDELRRKQSQLAAILEGIGTTLNGLQILTDEHRSSESTFISDAPTLADIEEAQAALASAQTVRSAVDSGAVAPVLMGLDLVQMEAAEQAQLRLTQLAEQRREAVRVFLEEQNRLHGQIRNVSLLEGPSLGWLGAPLPQGPAAVNPGVVGGTAVPGVPPRTTPVPAPEHGDRPNAPHTGAPSNVGADVPAAGEVLPVAMPTGPHAGMPTGAQTGMANPAALSGRFGPPVMPGYTIPGTAISAGTPTPMSDRDFNSLLDRIKADRVGMPSTTPTMPAGSGSSGGMASGAPSAARTVQPTSWINASTSPTGVAEGQNGRGASAPSSTSSTAAHPRSGMPMMPMMPGGANAGAANRDPKDQPQIKNADPDVYGDDVQTIDPIIDNQKGRFS